MTRKTTGSISRRRLLTTVSAGAALAASPFRINLLQAQEATIKIGFPVPLTGPYGAEAQDQVRAARSRHRRVQRWRRPQRAQGRTAGARRQAQSGRGRDAHAGTDREGKGELRRRQPFRRGAALGQQRHQGARHHLQLDQPVRRHQRGDGLQQIHLPRGAQSAHDRRARSAATRSRNSARRSRS